MAYKYRDDIIVIVGCTDLYMTFSSKGELEYQE